MKKIMGLFLALFVGVFAFAEPEIIREVQYEMPSGQSGRVAGGKTEDVQNGVKWKVITFYMTIFEHDIQGQPEMSVVYFTIPKRGVYFMDDDDIKLCVLEFKRQLFAYDSINAGLAQTLFDSVIHKYFREYGLWGFTLNSREKNEYGGEDWYYYFEEQKRY